MISTQSELVWAGRIHLGDEPGIYGDAEYPGIALEFPLTLRKIDPAGPDTTILVLHTEDLQTFSGYPGHQITVIGHLPDPASAKHATEVVLATAHITSTDQNHKEIPVNLAGTVSPVSISLRVRVDTSVPPGLYDDFVVTRLLNRSANYAWVASFGFSA